MGTLSGCQGKCRLRADGSLSTQGRCLDLCGGQVGEGPGGGERTSEPPSCPKQRATEPRPSSQHHGAFGSLGGDTWQEWNSGIFSPPSVLPLETSCLIVFFIFFSFSFFLSCGTHCSKEDPMAVAHITPGQTLNLARQVEINHGQVPLGDSTGRTQPSPTGVDVRSP